MKDNFILIIITPSDNTTVLTAIVIFYTIKEIVNNKRK
jgi:hypothetical protein